MTAFRMPSLGADMDEGTLVEWLKKPGDQLKRGDIIAVVETQKGAIEIEVFHDGVLEATHVKTGTRVPVGEVLATIRTAEEPELVQPAPPPEVVPQEPVYAPPAQVVAPIAPGLKITPAARSRAKELGIDVQSVSPGQDGIIGLKELEIALDARQTQGRPWHQSRRNAQGHRFGHGTQQARNSPLLCKLNHRHDGNDGMAGHGECTPRRS